MTDLLPGVRARDVETDRVRMHLIESGPEDGVPVLLIHGNLATGRFYEHLMSGAPDRYRLLAPDMRGFGRTERAPIDGSRGLADWADDSHALIQALGIEGPVHVVGWSTGGAAAARYAMDRPVASVTLIDPVSPYGFGGTILEGKPCFPDWAGTGGGTGNPEFTSRLAAGDRTDESPFSPRNVMNSSYWSPDHREPPEREEILLDEMLLSAVGDDHYPGDMVTSDNWPGIAPGTRGILNALSGKHCEWSGIVDLDPKPPVLWVHGSADIVIADGSAWEMGTLGSMDAVPGWPGQDVFPPQQMVTQIRTVLDRYRDAGGRVESEWFEGSGHFPAIDAADRFREVFFGFLDSAA